jgi:hypothetical protein
MSLRFLATRLQSMALDGHGYFAQHDIASMVKTADAMFAADARISALEEENKRLREALNAVLDRDQRNTCQHENTHRGGYLWEICDECGAKWADDEGGKPEWEDPAEWILARAALETKS